MPDPTDGRDVPRFADTVVVGGGTAGAAIAGLLAENSDESILLLEAGPDYGPLHGGGWPNDLTDARATPETHDWGYHSGDQYAGRRIEFVRARVLGGCSSTNGCIAAWGHSVDYEEWARTLRSSMWSSRELLSIFRDVSNRLRVRNYSFDEVTPFQNGWLLAAPDAGIPLRSDFNDLDQDSGIALSPVNIANGVRWNAAFAYIDPNRKRPNLQVYDNALADHVVIRSGRATGVVLLSPAGPIEIQAGRVVLAAGTYGRTCKRPRRLALESWNCLYDPCIPRYAQTTHLRAMCRTAHRPWLSVG